MLLVGASVGTAEGVAVGTAVGVATGTAVGTATGAELGVAVVPAAQNLPLQLPSQLAVFSLHQDEVTGRVRKL